MPAAVAISLKVAGRPSEAMTRKSETATTMERLPWRGRPFPFVLVLAFFAGAGPAIATA
jgi:hypothetical protein